MEKKNGGHGEIRTHTGAILSRLSPAVGLRGHQIIA